MSSLWDQHGVFVMDSVIPDNDEALLLTDPIVLRAGKKKAVWLLWCHRRAGNCEWSYCPLLKQTVDAQCPLARAEDSQP